MGGPREAGYDDRMRRSQNEGGTMYGSNRTSQRLAGLVALGLIVTALGAQGAQAASRPASSYYTPQALAALKLRSEAMNRLYASAERVFPSTELRALQIRSEAMNRLYGPAVSVVSPAELRALQIRGEALNRVARPTNVVAPSGGLDWGDVGIGVVATLGAMLIAAAGALVTLDRRRRSSDSSRPTPAST